MKVPKKDLSAFSLSFLDLLSGALGAVIILFILIPKINPIEHEDLKKDKIELETEVETYAEAMKLLKKKASEHASLIKEKDSLIQMYQDRLGFELKGKEMVFVVDASGSMNTDNRMTEVVAGIKMMVASMDTSFRIDIVPFQNSNYDALYRKLAPTNEQNKYKIYNYLSALTPAGGTPTGDAMEYVLKQSAYNNAGVIYLLSDGIPDGNAGSVLQNITSLNNGRKIINTIGVGKDFRDRNKSSDAKTFMEELAAQNGGFYIGF